MHVNLVFYDTSAKPELGLMALSKRPSHRVHHMTHVPRGGKVGGRHLAN